MAVPYKVTGKLHVVFPDELHFMHSQTINEMFIFSCQLNSEVGTCISVAI